MDLDANNSKPLCWKVKTHIFKLTPASFLNDRNTFSYSLKLFFNLENKEPKALQLNFVEPSYNKLK
tara:strand:+ start:2109 stop:2306 length:198 start_codon:yes stop_codon:yes gene_type:complete